MKPITSGWFKISPPSFKRHHIRNNTGDDYPLDKWFAPVLFLQIKRNTSVEFERKRKTNVLIIFIGYWNDKSQVAILWFYGYLTMANNGNLGFITNLMVIWSRLSCILQCYEGFFGCLHQYFFKTFFIQIEQSNGNI